MSRFVEAEEDCNKSLNLDPTFVKAYHRRGTARANTGKIELALCDFKKVLSIEPHNKAALQELERHSKSWCDKSSTESVLKEKTKDFSRKKGVSFSQSETEIKTKLSESEKLKKTTDRVDLSLNHPSLTYLEDVVLSVPKNVQSEPSIHIPIIAVNDSKQEILGIGKLVNQFSIKKNNCVEKNESVIQQNIVHGAIPPAPKNYIQFDQDFKKLGSYSNFQYQYLKVAHILF